MKTSIPRLSALSIAAIALLVFSLRNAEAGAVTPLHAFSYSSDGAYPQSPLTAGTDGFLYGTAYEGGAHGPGSVFKVSLSGSFTLLHSFSSSSSDGEYPYAGATLGPDGNVYGVTYQGGESGVGALYKITSSGSFSLLYSFTSSGTGGDYPYYATLVTATDGNLYGTASEGGANGYGTIFQVTTSGSFNPIYSMQYSDGEYLYGGLSTGTDGNLYGTSYEGGDNSYGTIFKITTSGSFTKIHSFDYSQDGGYPYGGVITGTDGLLYGLCYEGGSNGYGTIYQVAADGSGFTTLYQFGYYTDGGYPYGNLVQAPDGSFYGTTNEGGRYGDGTIFKMNVSGTAATVQIVHHFTGGTDGDDPYAGMVTGSDGNLYGTTYSGGQHGYGTIYKFLPAAPLFNTLAMSGLSASGATLNATVNPNGTATTAYFEYGTNTNYGTTTPIQVLGSGSNFIMVSATLSSLGVNTDYDYRLVVTSTTYGSFNDGNVSFTTLTTPSIVQNPASNVGSGSVVLSGTVNPDGNDTEVYFLYGPTAGYGFVSDAVQLGNSTDNSPVSIPVTGLLPNTQYHFILATSGSAGTFFGNDDTFTTGSAAIGITENPAQNVTSYGATLSGMVNPNGLSTAAWFEYGLTGAYGLTTTVQTLGNPTSPATLFANLSGLAPGKTYHFRLTGSSGASVVSGSDATFSTTAVIPGFNYNAVGGITTGAADLSGAVNPGGTDTQVYFVYGLNPSYGSQSATIDVGNGTTSINVGAILGGLLAGQTYHYKIVITNTNGTYGGGDQTFNTPPLSLTAALDALMGDAADDVPGTTFASFGTPVVNDNANTAFAATLASGTASVSKTNNAGIWADGTNGVRHLVARTSGTAPGVSGGTFSKFSDPVYNDNSQTAFVGTLQSGGAVNPKNNAGIWANTGGPLALVQRLGDQAPGCGAGVYFGAFKGMAMTDASIVFAATIAGTGVTPKTNFGIWLKPNAAAQAQLVARTGSVDTSTGKTIKTLTIFPLVPAVSGQSRSTDIVAGNIAYLATFTDGSSAVLELISN